MSRTGGVHTDRDLKTLDLSTNEPQYTLLVNPSLLKTIQLCDAGCLPWDAIDIKSTLTTGRHTRLHFSNSAFTAINLVVLVSCILCQADPVSVLSPFFYKTEVSK